MAESNVAPESDEINAAEILYTLEASQRSLIALLRAGGEGDVDMRGVAGMLEHQTQLVDKLFRAIHS